MLNSQLIFAEQTISKRGAEPSKKKSQNQKMSSQMKISIRFFNDREIRAVWDDENAKWRFPVLDVVGEHCHFPVTKDVSNKHFWYVNKLAIGLNFPLKFAQHQNTEYCP